MEKPVKIIAIVAEGQDIKGEIWNVPLKIICYNADEMDTYLAQKDMEISELVEALQCLYDEQNGAPLIKHQKDWEEAMDKAESALNKHKTINE